MAASVSFLRPWFCLASAKDTSEPFSLSPCNFARQSPATTAWRYHIRRQSAGEGKAHISQVDYCALWPAPVADGPEFDKSAEKCFFMRMSLFKHKRITRQVCV